LTNLPPIRGAGPARTRTARASNGIDFGRSRRYRRMPAPARGVRAVHDGSSLRRSGQRLATAIHHPRSVALRRRGLGKRRHPGSSVHLERGPPRRLRVGAALSRKTAVDRFECRDLEGCAREDADENCEPAGLRRRPVVLHRCAVGPTFLDDERVIVGSVAVQIELKIARFSLRARCRRAQPRAKARDPGGRRYGLSYV